MRAWLLLALPVALIALAAGLGLGVVGTGLLLGACVFAMLVAARIPTPMRFGAFGVAGGGMFGFMTAVMAELHGLAVQDLFARPFWDAPVPNTLGVLAVAFVTLGMASLVRGRLQRVPEPDSEQTPD